MSPDDEILFCVCLPMYDDIYCCWCSFQMVLQHCNNQLVKKGSLRRASVGGDVISISFVYEMLLFTANKFWPVLVYEIRS